MKKIVLALVLTAFVPLMASASLEDSFNAVPSCAGPVAIRENAFAIATNSRDVQVRTADGSRALPGRSAVRDLLLTDQTLFILRKDRIEEWDLATGELAHEAATLPDSAWIPSGGEARGMALQGDRILIAHGRMGFSVYSTTEHRALSSQLLLQDQLPLESEITGVIVDGDEAIFVATSYSLTGNGRKPAFRGFVVWDLASHREKHRSVGLDPGSRGLLRQGDLLLVDFGGLYQTFDLDEVRRTSKVRLLRSHWRFPAGARLLAGFDVHDSRIWSCASRLDGQTRRQSPLILDAEPLP